MLPKTATRLMNKLYQLRLQLQGACFGKNSQIHFSADIQGASNLIISPNSIIYKNVSIYIGANGNFTLGSDSHLAPFCYCLIDNNRLEIGNDVAVGPFTMFACHSNSYAPHERLFRNNYLDGNIIIGSNVFIGAHCTILPHTIIKDDVIVGANSVVSGELESGWIYAGSPAKKIKRLT